VVFFINQPDKICADQDEDCEEQAINSNALEDEKKFKQDKRMGWIYKGKIVPDIFLDIIEDIGILVLVECVHCAHIYMIIPSGTRTRYNQKKHMNGEEVEDPA
jgi:hypothetical protein